jgi:hypothetical protein
VEQQTSGPDLTDGFEIVARFHDDAGAEAAAEQLVLRGVGAMVERRPDHEAELVVLVVAGEAGRARDILGLAAPDADDRLIERPAKTNAFWIAIVFIAGMILLPLVAFYVSFKLAGG